MSIAVRVWDLPTRLFHWALVACIACSIVSGYIGGNAMVWHARFGYAILTLLMFRIIWGFIGGRWSRFASFLYSPKSVIAYLRGKAHPDHLVGHNPLGAGSVFAILAVLLVQVATGLVGDDEIAFTGPLNKFVESSQGLAATSYHKRIGQWLIVALAVLHIGAVLYYLWKKRDNLIRPMLVGDKTMGRVVASSRDDIASRLVALVVFAVCGGFVGWMVSLGG
ncbi:MAG: cytochrome b/b6 domain-containing protein [Ramlibacter sp.]|nr:cytochrome b/b6 domain-containing protein [Ramlibacter sp.]